MTNPRPFPLDSKFSTYVQYPSSTFFCAYKHWEYQALLYVQVDPEQQVVPPVKPVPPHWLYFGWQAVLVPVVVVPPAAVVVVLVPAAVVVTLEEESLALMKVRAAWPYSVP